MKSAGLDRKIIQRCRFVGPGPTVRQEYHKEGTNVTVASTAVMTPLDYMFLVA